MLPFAERRPPRFLLVKFYAIENADVGHLVGKVYLQFLQLRVSLALIDIGIERALDIEGGVLPDFGETGGRRDAVVSEIAAPGVGETLSPVKAEVDGAAIFECETLAGKQQLGIGIRLCLDLPGGAACLGPHDDNAGSEVAIFG